MEAWWHQEVPETQLRVTLENISREDRRRQQGKNNTHWEPEGETAGSGEIEFGDSGMEMGNSQVGGGPHAEAGDSGDETGNT